MLALVCFLGLLLFGIHCCWAAEGSRRVQLCGTKGGCGGAKKIACVFERSDWMFFPLFWPMWFARAQPLPPLTLHISCSGYAYITGEMCQHAPFRGTWHMLCAVASTPLAHYMIRARARFCYSQWGPGGGGGGVRQHNGISTFFPHPQFVILNSRKTSTSRSTCNSRGTCSTTTNAPFSDLFLQKPPKCRSRICKCWLSSSPRNINQPIFIFQSYENKKTYK